MKKVLAVTAVVLATALTTCGENRTPTSPSSSPSPLSPQFAISDGANGNGNPNFFFLPPLQPSPRTNKNFVRGAFNPNLVPTVKICDGRDLTPAGECVHPLNDKSGKAAVFTAVRGWDGLPDWVDPEQYHVLWQTKSYNLVVGNAYRILVKVGSTLLGYLDIVPENKLLTALKISAGGQDIGWIDDLVVPIRFRIQNGALCEDGTNPGDCSENTVVGAAPGTPGDTAKAIIVPSGYAALALPPGAVKPGDTVTVVIQNEPPLYGGGATAQCLPTGLAQSKGCWHFSSEPALYQFASPVRMEVCVDVEYLSSDEQNHIQLYKYNTTQGLQRLDSVPPTLINCSNFTTTASAAAPGPSSFASAALQQLGRWAGSLLAPPLYASLATGTGVPKGLGGTGGSFSDFGGAVPITPGVLAPESSVVTVSQPVQFSGEMVTLTLQARDGYGSNLTTGGATVVFTSSGGTSTGTISSTVDHGDGTYTATFTAVMAGTPTYIHASVNGTLVETAAPTIGVTHGPISASQTVVSVSQQTVASGANVTLTLQAKDAAGNSIFGGAGIVVFTASGGTSTGVITPSYATLVNGSYEAYFTGLVAGTATTIGATTNGTAVTSALPTVSVVPSSAPVLYGVNSHDDGLSIIDPATGQVAFVGPLSTDPGAFQTPVAMMVGLDGTLYAWNNSGTGGAGFVKVDKCTGLGTFIGTPAITSEFTLSPNGILYYVFATELRAYDVASGATATVGDMGLTPWQIVYEPSSRTIVGIIDQSYTSPSQLIRIDPGTATVTLGPVLNAVTGLVGGMAITATGELLVSANGGPDGSILFSLDETTGAVQNIRTLDIEHSPQGIGFGPACSTP